MKEYALDVVIALIEVQGLDAFQAVGLTSLHPNEIRRCFDEGIAAPTCGVQLMPFYHAGMKRS